MTTLDQLAAIRISGADHRAFLQGQLTQDLHSLRPDRCLLAGWNNPKGRLLAIGPIVEWQDAVWWILPAELIDNVVARLRMFVLRAKVVIETPELQVSGASTPAGSALATGLHLPDSEGACVAGTDSLLARVPGDGKRALLLTAAGANQRGPDPAALLEPAAWELADVRAGLPAVYATTWEAFVAQQVNLDLLGAISFKKGCYVGQEIVARTQHLGRIKRRMFRFESGDLVNPGDSLLTETGTTAGRIVRAAATGNGCELLAVVPLEHASAPLFTTPGQAVKGLPLPYDIPAGD